MESHNSSGGEDGVDVVHSALMEKGTRGTLAEAASDDSDGALHEGVLCAFHRLAWLHRDRFELMVSNRAWRRGDTGTK